MPLEEAHGHPGSAEHEPEGGAPSKMRATESAFVPITMPTRPGAFSGT